MIFGKLSEVEAYNFLLDRPIWRTAFKALENLTVDSPLGDFTLPGFPDALIRVMQYETKELSKCRFETHRKFVDLQYTISGGELILWSHRDQLEEDGLYDEEMDLQFYRPKDTLTSVHKSAGYFSIYQPSDAHRPQLNDGLNSSVFKAVIKLPVGQL